MKNVYDPIDAYRDVLALHNVKIDGDLIITYIEHGLCYCTPEYIEEGSIGPGTDLWSLGLIIYYMLTGKDAFAAPVMPTDPKWDEKQRGQVQEDIAFKIMAGDFM